jgi:uncharacterized damage-inducible protein DinB
MKERQINAVAAPRPTQIYSVIVSIDRNPGIGEISGRNEMKKEYRKGGIGALMDEYERAAIDLKKLIKQTSDHDFYRIIDKETKDEDCRSTQTIITHVVRAGYAYANDIRQIFSIASTAPVPRALVSHNEAVDRIDEFLAYTAETLTGKWEIKDDEIEAVEIGTSWGVKYNLEQLLEHAIVHILRHRRQIERLVERDEMS